jgi:hypothetical protein
VGTFSNHTRIFGLNNPADITPISTLPLLQGDIIAVSSNGEPGKLVVWMTGSDNLGANLPLGTQRFESSFRQNLLPDGWTVQVDSFFDPANGILHYRHSAVQPSVSRFRPDLCLGCSPDWKRSSLLAD